MSKFRDGLSYSEEWTPYQVLPMASSWPHISQRMLPIVLNAPSLAKKISLNALKKPSYAFGGL
jgi:hypothetical protein